MDKHDTLKAPQQKPVTWALPTRRTRAWFWLRSRGLIARQTWRNALDGDLRRWPTGERLAQAPVLAQVRTPLWTDGRDDEFGLVAGKVHNLRIAARAFHGVEIPADACLSFWQQLRRPTARRGFVVGREIRHGCVVPTLAGGICQLSNALATAAAQAGFTWMERHGHTARIEQASENGLLDATVFWNYVDLKLRAPVAWRIELILEADELVLTVRGERGVTSPVPITSRMTKAVSPQRVARSCLTCGEATCSLHQPWRTKARRSAWLLDAHTPEFERHLRLRQEQADRFVPGLPAWWRRETPRSDSPWVPGKETPAIMTLWTSLRRHLWLRLWARHAGGRRQASVLDGRRWLAGAYARRLRPEHAALVVDQSLLPHLQIAGVLGGRRYDVLASALPMDEIERRLDQARQQLRAQGIDAPTLEDFRADPVLIEAERAAMHGAHAVVTPHAEVAAHWRARGLRVHTLPWELPSAAPRKMARAESDVPCVVLAASALARKGAYELAQALQGWSCRLIVLGSASDDASLWQGIDVCHARYADDWPTRADVVVLPAHIEHAPRAALRAIAHGLPVLASPACGLQGLPGVTAVPAGDAAALRNALRQAVGTSGGMASLPCPQV